MTTLCVNCGHTLADDGKHIIRQMGFPNTCRHECECERPKKLNDKKVLEVAKRAHSIWCSRGNPKRTKAWEELLPESRKCYLNIVKGVLEAAPERCAICDSAEDVMYCTDCSHLHDGELIREAELRTIRKIKEKWKYLTTKSDRYYALGGQACFDEIMEKMDKLVWR